MDLDTMATNPFLVTAIQSYKAKKKTELSFKVDQVILVTKSNVKEFMYFGKLDGRQGTRQQTVNFPATLIILVGWFPYFYVKAIDKSQQFSEQRKAVTVS